MSAPTHVDVKPLDTHTPAPQTQLLKCEWCPCVFCSQEDLDRHLKAIGKNQYDHRVRWKLLMQERQRRG